MPVTNSLPDPNIKAWERDKQGKSVTINLEKCEEVWLLQKSQDGHERQSDFIRGNARSMECSESD